MTVLRLVPASHELLRQKMERFDFKNPPIDPSYLAKDLAETMIAHNGVGLSANQVGLPYRVFVITGNPIIACFNPIIVDKYDEDIFLDEGCLTYPDYFVKIRRPKSVRVRFTMPNGETVTRDFVGLTARIFQHEYDHLEGELFKDKANAYHRERANKDFKIAQRRAKRAKRNETV